MSIIAVHGPNTFGDGEVHVATAGTPGSFPANQEVPANLAELNAEVVPSPKTAWTANATAGAPGTINVQYVTLLDASTATWNGTTWRLATNPPANLAALAALVPAVTPATAWTTGQHVLMAGAVHAYWNGTAWAAGNAP